MKQALLLHFRILVWAVLFLGCIQLSAQSLNKPVPAPNQTPPPGSTAWNKACASPSFNDYWVRFTWNPPLVNADNEFILELSDAAGNFSDAVEVAREDSKNLVFDFYFQFALPVDTRGEGYKFRVKSTSPAQTSPASDAFAMYYIDVTSGLTVRPQGQTDFGDGMAQVCDGNSITLEVYALPNSNTYQYNWYRSGTPLSEKSDKLTVSQAGMYNVEIDYGSCSGSGNTLSNIIDVSLGSSLGLAIVPPAKTDLCSGETLDLVADISGAGLTYIWFRDGSPVTAPTINDDTYTVDASIPGFEGGYQVEISGPGICVERSPAVAITSAGGFTVTRDNPSEMVILPSQPVTLSVSTTAGTPVYQWYRNGSAIPGANAGTLEISDVSDAGDYHADVSQSGDGCPSVVTSEATRVSAPASYEFIIDYATPYLSCQHTSIALEVSRINVIDTDGGSTDVTAQMRPLFTYQWKKDGNPVPGATSNTISLTDAGENGNYKVEAQITGFDEKSEELPVQLLGNESLSINSTGLISCGAAEDITISTDADLTNETYQWLRNGANLQVSGATVDITEAGTYQLVIDRNGCPLRSNEVVIAPLDESLITMNPSGKVVFPEGSSRTINASGGDSYRWYDANNTEVSNTSSLTLTEEGSYMLVATVGNCELTRSLTAEYLETFQVPNVITVNGDGINDLWVLPNSYSNKPGVSVLIYNDRGEEIFNETDYKNNWPQSSMSFPKQNMIFYYKIRNGSEVLKQGTITIIR